MWYRLPAPLRGVLSLLLFLANLVVWFTLFFLVMLPKLVMPFARLRERLGRVLEWLATAWIAGNGRIIALTQRTVIEVRLPDDLSPAGWYLVLANHRGWMDIVLLQVLFNDRIPLLRFFIKRQLIWLPMIGLCCRALDFPFMQRYSRAELAAHPELAGRDLETTRRACEIFRRRPTSIMNFIEGTRFTPAKHAAQESPYQHLLRPRAGGVGFVLDAMGELFDALLDVTLHYDVSPPTTWSFLCGRMERIVVRVQERQIPEWALAGHYDSDPAFRERLQAWISSLWTEKDCELGALAAELPGSPAAAVAAPE